MVQRYYYWAEFDTSGNEGQVYTISPKTTETEKNVMQCHKKNISEEEQNHDAFPVEGGYVYAGNQQHEGRQVDVWQETDEYDDTREENIMYTYKGARGVDVPVQIVKKTFNTFKGTMTLHVIYNYFSYEPLICYKDLDADEDLCDVANEDLHGTLQVLHPAIRGDVDIAFESFKKHHNRKYRSQAEHEKRKKIFQKNWQLVVDHNSKNLGYKLAMNHLSDLSTEELRVRNGARASFHPAGSIPFPHSEAEVNQIVTHLPKEYDMRMEGFITPIKNQGSCGSCWSFATVAAVEGALARLDGRLRDLSEQTLIDCSWGDAVVSNQGCEGGYPSRSLRYVMKHGLPLEEGYGGYKAQNGYCHTENATEVFKIRGFALATPMSVNAMKVALYKYGPVTVLLQANDAFSFYSSGIFFDPTCDGSDINHAVTIVGYGTRDGDDYWIVKNSYGEQWGEEGFMLYSTNDDKCRILSEPYYPVV
ncbi:cathepsin K-like [Choristoneura fumiferana]|uniref:cathepsin K-like n=1 Tax=Choristoneura fumiferana TaxID=7141 RepID=UPI003D154940